MAGRLVAVVVLALAIGAAAQTPVKVGVYTEALCPGCKSFLTGQLIPAMQATGLLGITNIHFVPFGNARENADKTFTCQHGVNECKGNMVQACGMYAYPAQATWWPFIACLERGTPHTDGQRCAQQSSLSWDNINACIGNSSLSYQVMHAHAQDTKNLKPAHQYTPWITLNDKPLYEDFNNIKQKICAAYTGTKPSGCTRTTDEEVAAAAAAGPVELCTRD